MTKYVEELIEELQAIRDTEGNAPVAIQLSDTDEVRDIDHIEFDAGIFIVAEDS